MRLLRIGVDRQLGYVEDQRRTTRLLKEPALRNDAYVLSTTTITVYSLSNKSVVGITCSW